MACVQAGSLLPSEDAESDSEDEGMEVGPTMATTARFALPQQSAAPIGMAVSVEDEMAMEDIAGRQGGADRGMGQGAPATLEGAREEWMLTPGERKPFGGDEHGC